MSRSKDEFLATLSHELRTPLNAVLGFARLLSSGRMEGSNARRAVDAIERNALAQAQLIEDLLDVSRIISGKLRLELSEINLAEVVVAAVETVRPALHAKEIRFDVTMDSAVGDVMGDPNRLQQIVWNLLSNAIKFTPKGGQVQLSVARNAEQIELTVSDSGQGMDAAFLPLVFHRFYQVDGSATRKHGGLGLGLAICRHLAELHGGSIEAASDGPGRGATFTVFLPVLPLRRDPSVPTPARALVARPRAFSPSDALREVKVLVVDDEPDARELLTWVVAACGGIAIEASSASEALGLLASENPDVLVSDIGMPGEDGYSLIHRVRALPPEQGGKTPAVALTAYARVEDRVRVLAAGFELYLTKPVNPDDFVAVVANLVQSVRAARPSPPQSSPG